MKKKAPSRKSAATGFHPGLILAPVDFSNPNKDALKQAVQLARQYGAKLRLLHVIEPPPYPEFGYAHIAAKEARLKRVAAQRLQELRAQAPLRSVSEVDIVIRYGRASSEIVTEAADSKADLIVLATHGYTGLFHVLLGSTAEQVVRGAPCPVWVERTGNK